MGMESGAAGWENLSWITATLAIGGSFNDDHVAQLARRHRVRAIVDLRVEACDDEATLRQHGIRFLHLPTEDGCGVSLPMLEQGVRFVGEHLARDQRVFIHCEYGIGRSATLALCVLVSRGLAPLDALALAKDRREVMSPSPAQFEAWATWLRAWRDRHRPRWEPPSFEAFRAIAYRHLPTGGVGTGR
ncbi:MAG TPA: dual specificity protein phosphatase family protein [Kofleriaceae bacterium]|jgi:protein-tyrosine phosphatase|nr:dual specificity protein phosphatase family protein [Gaiellales bacterium]HVK74491.1 dual specificity protein phosphatase family protein [Kofleriaceae bacterium]